MTDIQDNNLNNIIDLSTASQETGYHQNYLSLLCRQGILKGFKAGRNWLIARDVLNEFVQNHQNGILEVADETGQKIPVHASTASPSDSAAANGEIIGTGLTAGNIGTGAAIISLAEASQVTGYHQDYLAFLCRTGKLQATKIGRNWVSTKTALDDFVKNYQNGISEVADETGNKIPVHVTNVVTDKVQPSENLKSENNFNVPITPVPQTAQLASASGKAEAPFNTNLLLETLAAEQPRLELNNLKQSVFEGLERRLSKLDGSLGELEREVQAGTFQTKFLNNQQQKVLEQSSVIPVLLPNVEPRQSLREKFASNFPFEGSLGQPASQTTDAFWLGKQKIKELYNSFKVYRPSFTPAYAIAGIIAAIGLVGSVLLSGFLTDSQLAQNNNRATIVYRQSANNNTQALNGQTGTSGQPGGQNQGTVIVNRGGNQTIINQLLGMDQAKVFALIDQRLNQYLLEGKFKGERGEAGTPGQSGGSSAITYIQPSAGGNGSGSMLGITYLSSQDFITNNATVNNSFISNGTATFNGAANLNGSTTIASLTVGNINPGFTAGSVAFQGTNGLTQDNSNLYYDNSNKRLGIGTGAPSANLTIVANASSTPLIVASSSGATMLSLLQNGDLTINTSSPLGNLAIKQINNGDTIFYAQRNTDTAPAGDFINYTSAAGASLFRVDTGGNITGAGSILGGAQTITATTTPQLSVQYNAQSAWTASTNITGNTTFAFNGTSAPSAIFIPQFNSVNTFSFQTASSSPVLSIDTLNRRVGINTSTPQTTFSLIGVGAADPFDIASSSTASFLRVTAAGNVGIGTTTPLAQLTINNSQLTRTVLQVLGKFGQSANLLEVGNDVNSQLLIVNSFGNLGIGTTSPLAKLDIWGNFNVATGTVPAFYVNTATGNVGVGTNNPAGAFEVVGQCVTGDTKLKRRRKKKKYHPAAGGGTPPRIKYGAGSKLGGETAGGDGNNAQGASSARGFAMSEDAPWAEDGDYEYDEVRIDQVAPGDEILSMELDGSFTWSRVNKLQNMGRQETYKLITRSGKAIRTTGNHPYFALEKRPASKLHELYASFEVDQSNRLEDMGVDSVVALASSETDQVVTVKIAKKLKLKIFKQHYGNRPKSFGPEMLSTLILYAIWGIGLKVGRLVIDKEYPNYENEISAFIRRTYPELVVNFRSIGHQAMAHRAAWSRATNKKTPQRDVLLGTMASLDFKESLAVELLHSGLVTGDSQPTRSLIDLLYHSPLMLSRGEMSQAEWIEARRLRPGMLVATVDGWEAITAIYKTGITEQTYDIEVEGTHNFVGNDIVAHNTAIFDNRVSVGTSSPVSDVQLYVQGQGSNAAFTIASSSGSTLLTVLGNGNVGVGTSSPSSKLDIWGNLTVGTSSTPTLFVNTATGNVGLGTSTPSSFKLQVQGDVGPDRDLTYNLGSPTLRWNNIYASGNITLATFTQGSILFAGAGGTISQNNSNFFWDNSNKYFNIGTSTISSTLAIQGSGSANPFTIASSSGSTLMTVLANGNVGIGTVSPTSTLYVQGSGSVNPFQVSSSTGTGLMIITSQGNVGIGTSTNVTARLVLQGSGSDSTTNALQVNNSAGTGLVTIQNNGNVGIGTSTVGSRLVIQGSGNTSATTALTVQNSDGTGMVSILNNGNVGIGTTSPVSKLDIWGNLTVGTSSTPTLFVNTSTGFVGAGTTSPLAKLDVWGNFNVATGSIPSFYVNTATGNVGVGTNNPAGAFEVVGQCVEENTLLRIRRRRKRKKSPSTEDEEDEFEYLTLPIKAVEAGDEALSLNQQTNEFEYHTVNALLDKGMQTTYLLKTDSGRYIETTGEHPYLVRSFEPEAEGPSVPKFAFVDETGIIHESSQPEMGVGALVVDDLHLAINQELRNVLLEAVHKLNQPQELFEFKFTYITPRSLPYYKKLLAVLRKHSKRWQFAYSFGQYNHCDFWRHYLSLFKSVFAEAREKYIVVADYLNKPGKSKVGLMDAAIETGSVVNVLQAESQGIMFLQVADILLGALAFLRKSKDGDKYKRIIALEVASLLKLKEAGMDPVHAASASLSAATKYSIADEKNLSREPLASNDRLFKENKKADTDSICAASSSIIAPDVLTPLEVKRQGCLPMPLGIGLLTGSTSKQKWTKVSQLKPGMEIAVCAQALDDLDEGKLQRVDSKLRFEKIVSIEQIQRKQMYDIEIEGTHNFVAGHLKNSKTGQVLSAQEEQKLLAEMRNDITALEFSAGGGSALGGEEWNEMPIEFAGIVAHNTAIFDNRVSVGTSSPVSDVNLYVAGQPGNTPLVVASSSGSTLLTVLGNGNVGIGTSSPSSFKLQVQGDVGPDRDLTYNLGSPSLRWNNIYSGGNFNVAGVSNLATSTISNLTVTNTTTLASNINLTGTNPVIDLTTGSTLFLNTVTNRPVTFGTGLITLGGNLQVAGNATTTGNQIISGALGVSGVSTLATTTISNLTVTNTTTLATLLASGSVTFSGNSNLATTTIAQLTVTGNSQVNGNATTSGNMIVLGSQSVTGNLNITGTSTLATTTTSQLTANTLNGNIITTGAGTLTLNNNTLMLQGGNTTLTGDNSITSATIATSTIDRITLNGNGNQLALQGGNTILTGTNAITSSTIATSTVATSTISGLIASNSTLNNSIINNLTGIGNNYSLYLFGTSSIDQSVTTTSTPTFAGLTINGNSTTTGNLVITGNQTVTGNLAVSGTSQLATSTISNLTVTNTSTLNTLIASGAVQFTNTATFATTTIANLTVTNTSTLATLIASGSVTFTGNSTFATTTVAQLTVTGSTSLAALTAGNSQINGNSTTTGNSVIVGNQLVSGNATTTGSHYIDGNFAVNGNSAITGNQAVTGNSTTTGNQVISGNFNVAGISTMATTTISNLSVTNTTTLASNLNLTGANPVIDLTTGSTLFINSVTNRPVTFGSGLVTLGGGLNVTTGNVNLSTVSGNVALGNSGGTFTVSAATSTIASGAISLTGTNPVIDLASGILNLNTVNNQPVTFGTGLVTLGGNFSVTGSATTTGNAVIVGNQLISGNATTTGNLIVLGNQSLTGSLNVIGTSQLATTTIAQLIVTGNSQVNGDTIVTGNATTTGNQIISGALNVAGASTLATTTISNLTVTNTTTLSSNLNLIGTNPIIDLTSASTLGINTVTNRPITFGSGLATFGGNVTISGTTTTIASTVFSLTGASPVFDATTGTLNLNTTNNSPITTGTGLFTLGGNLQVNGATTTLASANISLTGASPILDATTGTLNINTLNNQPITFGSGLLTAGGSLLVTGSATTTANQIILGNLSVSGVGNFATSTIAKLTVTGDLTTGGNATTSGSHYIGGNFNVSGLSALATTTIGNLTITNTTTLASNINLTGTNPVIDLTTSSTLFLNTVTNRPITTGSGLVTFGGNVLVSGATTTLASTNISLTGGSTNFDLTSGTLNFNTLNNHPVTFGSGLVTLGGNLQITGNATTTGNQIISGTLGVIGISQLATSTIANLTVTNTSTLATLIANGNVTFSGNSTFATTTIAQLTVTGNSQVNGNATTTGNYLVQGTLFVTGTSTLATTTIVNFTVSQAPTVTAFNSAGVVHNSASGLLSSSLIVNNDITNSTIDLATKVTGILPVSNGGTGAASLTANDILFGNGTGVVATSSNFTFTGGNLLTVTGSTTITTLNQALPVRSTAAGALFNGAINLASGSSDITGILSSANGGSGTTTSFTAGSVIFSNGSSLAQNNSNFFWDNANNRLGLGTSSPSGLLDVFGSNSSTTLTTFIGGRSLSIVNTDQTNNNAAGLAFRTLDANGVLTTAAKFDAVYTSHTANQVSGDMVLLTNNAGTISEKMRVMSTGNVGIGSTSPTALLALQGTSGSATDLFNVASSTNTSVFIVKSSGNVGIGTTGPGAKLDFGTSGGPQTILVRQNGNSRFGFGFDGNYNFQSFLPSDIAAGGGFTFGTMSVTDGATFSEKVRITKEGNVGIGTTGPLHKLEVFTLATAVPSVGPVVGLYRDHTSGGYGATLSEGVSAYTGGDYLGLGFVVAGTPSEAVRIDSSGAVGIGYDNLGTTGKLLINGNVGIGTSAPATKLSIQGTAGANDLLNIASSSGTSVLYINNQGNVGIGTTAPGEKLQVAGGMLWLTGLTTNTANLNGVGFWGGDNGGGIYPRGTNGAGSFSIGNTQGSINLSTTGNVGIGTTSPNAKLNIYIGASGIAPATASDDLVIESNTDAGISFLGPVTANQAIYFGDTGSNLRGAVLYDHTNDAMRLYAAGAEKVRIDNQGNVGIGTTNPGNYRLNVLTSGSQGLDVTANGSTVSAPLAYFVDSASGYADLEFYFNATNAVIGTWGDRGIQFVGNQGTEVRMTLQNDGNVGIGTTTPVAKLSLQGTAGAYDMLDIASSTGTSVLRITNQGNVGIGTTAPNYANLVIGSASYYSGNTAGEAIGRGTSLPTATSNYGNLYLFSTDALAANTGGTISFGANYNGVGDSKFVSIFGGKENANSGDLAGYFSVVTRNAAGTLSEGMRINSLGNVGIGTVSPTSTLYVQGSGSVNPFQVSSSTGTGLMIITSQGNVGIGTTTAPQKLTIAGGNVLISNGWLCVGNGSSTPANGSCTTASTTAAGTIYANSISIVQGDYAERYPSVDGNILPGMLVAADGQNSGHVIRATSTTAAMGVVSTAPGIVIGDTGTNASSTTYAVALSGRVPVKVTNENGNIKIGDYITVSAQFYGYGMKAASAGQVLGRALENFDSSITGHSGVILVFIQPTYFQPKVSDLVQNAPNTGDSGLQAWLSSLANLNMTDASVFGGIAVIGSVAIQKDLHVGGIIYAATLNVDTINAKKLCLGQTCVTEDQLKKLLQIEAAQPDSGQVAGVSSPTPTTAVVPPTADPAATNSAPADVTPQPTLPTIQTSEPAVPISPAVDTPPAETQGQTGNVTAPEQSGNLGTQPSPDATAGAGGASDSAPAPAQNAQ